MKRLLLKSKIFQWTMFVSLLGVASIAFVVIMGEEGPGSPLTTGEFCFVKAGAFGIICVCYRVGKLLFTNGLMPKCVIDKINKEVNI